MTSCEKLKYVLEHIIFSSPAFWEHISATDQMEAEAEQSDNQLIQISLKSTGTISMLCERDSAVETVEDHVSQCSNQVDIFYLIVGGKLHEKAPEFLRRHQYTYGTRICTYRRHVGYRVNDCEWKLSQNPLA